MDPENKLRRWALPFHCLKREFDDDDFNNMPLGIVDTRALLALVI
jgi:hypothetical protein